MPRVELASGTPAELALPPDGDPLRAVVIAPDIMGLRPLFDDLCARLATEQKWAALAVEPFPEGGPSEAAQRLNAPIDVERMVRDLELGADLIQERTGARRVGVLGFCMGGMNAFRAAGTGRFDRAVAFYGMVRPPKQWSLPGSDPLDALSAELCCPVLALFGGRDTWTPAADIQAARDAGPHVTARVYEEAEHGFVHDASRPAHRAGDAADAWKWVQEFLA